MHMSLCGYLAHWKSSPLSYPIQSNPAHFLVRSTTTTTKPTTNYQLILYQVEIQKILFSPHNCLHFSINALFSCEIWSPKYLLNWWAPIHHRQSYKLPLFFSHSSFNPSPSTLHSTHTHKKRERETERKRGRSTGIVVALISRALECS